MKKNKQFKLFIFVFLLFMLCMTGCKKEEVKKYPLYFNNANICINFKEKTIVNNVQSGNTKNSTVIGYALSNNEYDMSLFVYNTSLEKYKSLNKSFTTDINVSEISKEKTINNKLYNNIYYKEGIFIKNNYEYKYYEIYFDIDVDKFILIKLCSNNKINIEDFVNNIEKHSFSPNFKEYKQVDFDSDLFSIVKIGSQIYSVLPETLSTEIVLKVSELDKKVYQYKQDDYNFIDITCSDEFIIADTSDYWQRSEGIELIFTENNTFAYDINKNIYYYLNTNITTVSNSVEDKYIKISSYTQYEQPEITDLGIKTCMYASDDNFVFYNTLILYIIDEYTGVDYQLDINDFIDYVLALTSN